MNTTPKKHILIIDDAMDQQFLLKSLLESKGYKVDCTSNGQEAIVFLKTMEIKPSLILLDLNMPVMGGIDFRNIQRVDPNLKDIPVVILSGEDDSQATRRKTNVEVLKKPISMATLITTVEKKIPHELSRAANN